MKMKNLIFSDTEMRERLEILANWLKETSLNNPFYKDIETDGTLENAIKSAQEEVCYKIGDYLEEILAMDDEQIKEEKNGR